MIKVLGLAAALLAAGCVDDIVKQFIPVAPVDGEVPVPDAAFAVDADGFSLDKLTLTAAKPAHGPFVGGTDVILSGTGFRAPLQVTVGGKAVQQTDIKVLSPIGASIVTPAGEVGPAEITVTSGNETVELKDGFYYDPISVDPDSGPTAGGTLVTIQGRNTNFQSGMKLEVGGQPMVDVEVLSATMLRAKTPPSIIGPADIKFGEPKGDRIVPEAFTYYNSTNPKNGGMGGGPLQGTLTVSTLNWMTRAPVDGATVVVQKERELELSGTTDTKGVAVFTDAKLTGKVSVTAARTGFEATTVVTFDARDLTIFLMPIAQPQPGPLPPGTLAGVIKGHVLFGGTTGAGSSQWKLVPEPKADQVRRIQVFSSVPSVSWGAPSATATATMDDKGDGATAWPFTLVGYTGALAVYAVAGLYTQATGHFEPYAMGVTRGVVVGPGETVQADVLINAPLAEKVTIELKDVPPGMAHHSATLAVDLGADGLIILPEWEIAGDGVFSKQEIGRLPLFNYQGLVDATFTLDLLLESGTADGLPLTRATERAVMPKSGVILVDELLGGPQQLKPPPGGVLQGNTLAWSQSGAKHDIAVTVLRLTDETPVWRVISPGDVTEVQLPDPQTFGLPAWPEAPLIWLQWLARLPGFDYDHFTYSQLSSSYWDRWSFDELSLTVQ